MCRPKAMGGRRCPRHSSGQYLALRSAQQSAERMGNRLEAAEVRGIGDAQLQKRTERLIAAHERVSAREQAMAASPAGSGASGASEGGDDGERGAVGPARPTRADEVTAERVNAMNWDEVSEFSRELDDDPEAWERLETLVNEREQREADEELNAWLNQAPPPDPLGGDPVREPASRPQRRMSAREVAREEYESYVASQYFKAEEETNGVLLNAEGRAKGIDEYSLFSGPVSRVKKYGSEELNAFFGREGRHTLSSYRHSVLGWHSDQKAAQRAKVEDFAHVANV